MLKTLLPLFIVCSTLLAGCGSSMPAIKPFKMDIQQGNVVTSKMLLQLKPGMTKSQVRFIMGTPLIVDSFHKNRWDYFYQMRQAGKIVEQRRVILDFDKDLLTKVRGDVVPQGSLGAANEGAASGGGDTSDSNVPSAPITVEPKPKETSMLDKLKFWKKDEKAIATAEVVMPAVTAPVEIAAEALPAAKTLAAADAPSILAVPIELPSIEQPAVEQPSAQSTKQVAQIIDAPKDESVVAAPLTMQQNEAIQKPSITGKDSLQPFKSPSEKLRPAKPDFIKPIVPNAAFNKVLPPKSKLPDSQLSRPLKPLSIADKKDEKLIFRLDKNFDISRADEMTVELLPANALPADVTQKVDNQSKLQNADLEPSPPESEPSFFDKMLEKIGF